MPHIEQLSPHVADLIAAGEVVERPASVVKELLENAIDAGASAVTVEIRSGGMTYLRVTDDGCGIAPQELPTAFLRHATSKLRREEDLAAIGTLGFRGEALAAIASVSRVEVLTRERGASVGASLALEGGVPGRVEEAGCPEGTTIVVRDLFFNTPARLKFMKRDSAEATAIAGLVAHLALSHADISFRFIKDGTEELHTPGDGKLASAVYAALGRSFALELLPVDGRDGELRAEGFVTKPLNGRGSRAMQTFFVNGRFVKSQLLTAALEEAYANRSMKGRFPGCVLRVTLPLDTVDVNVHPAKTVVKFLNEKIVFDLVYHAVCAALDADGMPVRPAQPTAQSAAPAPTAKPAAQQDFFRSMSAQEYRAAAAEQEKMPAFKTKVPPVKSELGGYAELHDFTRRTPALQPAMPIRPVSPAAPTAPAAPIKQPAPPVEVKKTEPAPAEPKIAEKPAEPQQETLLPETEAPWRIAGEVLDTYIICEDGEKNIYLIDKHAAHERINFDRLRAMQEPIMPQMLLSPIAAEFSPAQYEALTAQLPLLEEFGFRCEEFGTGCLLVREIPSDIAAEDAAACLEELAERLVNSRGADASAARDALLHTMACKAAIKGGWKSDIAELRVLVQKVQSGEVRFCPHGRPVAVKMTKYELEKMFKRA